MPLRPNAISSATPPTTGGSTSGSVTSARTRLRPRNRDPGQQPGQAGCRARGRSPVEIVVVTRLSRSAIRASPDGARRTASTTGRARRPRSPGSTRNASAIAAGTSGRTVPGPGAGSPASASGRAVVMTRAGRSRRRASTSCPSVDITRSIHSSARSALAESLTARDEVRRRDVDVVGDVDRARRRRRRPARRRRRPCPASASPSVDLGEHGGDLVLQRDRLGVDAGVGRGSLPRPPRRAPTGRRARSRCPRGRRGSDAGRVVGRRDDRHRVGWRTAAGRRRCRPRRR